MFLLSVGRPYYWKIVGMGKGTNWEKIEQVEGVSTLIVFLILVDRVLNFNNGVGHFVITLPVCKLFLRFVQAKQLTSYILSLVQTLSLFYLTV